MRIRQSVFWLMSSNWWWLPKDPVAELPGTILGAGPGGPENMDA